MEIFKRSYPSPFGLLTICSTKTAIVEISFDDNSSFKLFDPEENIFPINKTALWFKDYFQGKKPDINNLPLQTTGTVFQEKIWDRLLRIPYGKTITYGEIAREIAIEYNMNKMSAQAVGQAVRANPICIIIPCHRVIGSNGQLTGFSGGIDKKKLLLEHEAKYTKQLGQE